MTNRETEAAVIETRKGMGKIPMSWNTHTALGVIILSSLLALAVLRGSLAKGGAVQP